MTADVPEAIWLDPVRSRQCFSNLLSNAVKFTDQGSIDLHVRCLALSDSHAELVLDVHDTGIGLSEGDQERIFETFVRSENPEASLRPGAGMGLAITRSLAQQMGGDLTVRSTLGRGSTFSFRWTSEIADENLLRVSESQPRTSDEKVQEEHDIRILLAEDHPGNRKVISVFLGSVGLSADMVENGSDLVCRANEEKFDILFVDVHMPEMSGLDAVKVIRSGGGPNKTTPIVMLTADAGDHALQTSRDHGADAHITKPIDANELFSAIEQFTSGSDRHPV